MRLFFSPLDRVPNLIQTLSIVGVLPLHPILRILLKRLLIPIRRLLKPGNPVPGTGDLRVTIASVSGDVVTGSFSGINYDGKSLTGTFNCRVKDYIRQVDLASKWFFGESEIIFGYRLFGGNVLNASLSQNAGRYLLTINGESDNGQSVFKMVLSSTTSIAAGNYVGSFMSPGKHIDSLYFRSPVKIWNGNDTYLYSDDASQYPVYVSIDAIDQQKVTGTIYGNIRIGLSSGSITSAYIKEGKFSASL